APARGEPAPLSPPGARGRPRAPGGKAGVSKGPVGGKDRRAPRFAAPAARRAGGAGPEPLHRVLDACRAARADDDLRSLMEHPSGDREADAGAAADDDDALILEGRIGHARPPPRGSAYSIAARR